jgi:hypothetical protein
MQDRGTAELWVQGAQQYETMDSVDKERYSHLVSWWLIFYANIYYQQRQKLLDEEIYARGPMIWSISSQHRTWNNFGVN